MEGEVPVLYGLYEPDILLCMVSNKPYNCFICQGQFKVVGVIILCLFFLLPTIALQIITSDTTQEFVVSLLIKIKCFHWVKLVRGKIKNVYDLPYALQRLVLKNICFCSTYSLKLRAIIVHGFMLVRFPFSN